MPAEKGEDIEIGISETHAVELGGQTSEIIRNISNRDAAFRCKEAAADNGISTEDTASDRGLGGVTIISWDKDDKENPYNWSGGKKTYIVITTMFLVINSTMGSSLPSMAVPFMMDEWGITSKTQRVLPISIFMIGFVLGPIIWAPLCEHTGRLNISLVTFGMSMVWTMACALSPNWTCLLVFRFLTGAFASAPIAVVAGFIVDIYSDPLKRGRAMAFFMATTVFGPLLAPIISGFTSTTIGWRWTFWVALIYAGTVCIMLIWLPETYAPILLRRRAAKIRKQNPDAQVYEQGELERMNFKELAMTVLTRPLRMMVSELIVSSTCMYLSLCYSIFYMSFQAFPLIFQGIYGLAPGVTGLCFFPIGAGALLAIPIFFLWDHILLRAQASQKPWAKREEFRRLPLACVGGPLFSISLFWLGWSAAGPKPVPFVVPMLAGVPFGTGFMLIFMALLNYLTDAYDIFAASANAAASACRSLVAVVLPLATTPMFARMGVAGACSLLGGLSALMCVIPFLFIWKGEQIRAGSRFCIALKEQKNEMERRAQDEVRRREASVASTWGSEWRESVPVTGKSIV